MLAARGAQKLLGWFGGGGPRATTAGFERMGFRIVAALVALSVARSHTLHGGTAPEGR